LSVNNGTSWIEKNQGFNTIHSIYSLEIVNGYIFSGTGTKSIWRRSISEIIGVHKTSSKIPDRYSLFQNYPNPFNPSTTIKFQIERLGFVNLTVYDMNGRLIKTLVNEELSTGSYETIFDAGKYSSGTYFYKLEAGSFSAVKKMILIK
jgi:hypothetical protein